jgi:carbon-monoxide dehydrogenase medium subunit
MMKDFEYFRAKSLEELLMIKTEYQSEILAGGTDLIIKMKKGKKNPTSLIDIKRIPDINKIEFNPDGSISIGPLVTFTDILDNSLLKQKCPILYQAAEVLGTTQIRNRATIGGNICNGSPAADSLPPLICLEAQLLLINTQGERWMPIEKFYKGPQETCLRSDEFLSEIRIPPFPPKTSSIYLKLGVRKSLEIAIVNIGILATSNGDREVPDDIKISLGSVAPTPIRSRKAEDVLRGEKISKDLIENAAFIVQKDTNPISDLRGTAEYRYEMAYVMTKKALEKVFNQWLQGGNKYV